MSDCFDHALDAFESLNHQESHCDVDSWGNYHHGGYQPRKKKRRKVRWYDHPVDELIRETEKAYLFREGNMNFWIPKSQCVYKGDNTVRLPDWLDVAYKDNNGKPIYF